MVISTPKWIDEDDWLVLTNRAPYLVLKRIAELEAEVESQKQHIIRMGKERHKLREALKD